MAKSDFIHNTINVFREKLDTALKGDNAGEEILQAVQELLAEINAQYPQTAVRQMVDNSRKNSKNFEANNKLPDAKNDNIPDGVQFLLNNIAARSRIKQV